MATLHQPNNPVDPEINPRMVCAELSRHARSTMDLSRVLLGPDSRTDPIAHICSLRRHLLDRSDLYYCRDEQWHVRDHVKKYYQGAVHA